MGQVGFLGRTRRYPFLLVRGRSGAGVDGATPRRRPAWVIFGGFPRQSGHHVRDLSAYATKMGRSLLRAGMVLEACPDIVDYAKGGISNWRDLLIVAAVVRSVLGISPSAWEAAQSVMGELPAAIVVAAILQRGAAITSAGGYLRELTRKAEAGEFTLGPMLMALMAKRNREKKRA